MDLNIKGSIPLLQEYGEFCEQRFNEIMGIKLDHIETFLMTILLRNGISTNSLIIFLPYYFEDINYKLPVSLILRSINSDYLTLLYLATFDLKSAETQTSLENELKIFDKDLLVSIETFAKEEYYFNLKFAPDNIKNVNSYKDTQDFLHKNYSEYYNLKNNEYKIKSEEEFRQTSLPQFFLNPKEKRLQITERNKFNRIKAFNEDDYAVHAYMAFKYYSQFQHPSPLSKLLLVREYEQLDKRLFIHSIEHLIIGTQLLLKLFYKKDEVYLIEMKSLQEKLIKITKE